jgi:hypothetical protein
MPDANLPGIGGIPKPFLIGGVILAGGIGLYAYRKKKSEDAAAATASTGAESAYGYAGSGYSYGSSPIATGGGYGTYGYGAYGGYGYGSTQPAPVTNNAEWAQNAETYLSGNGYSPITVAAALGKYITGQTLSSDQASIVQAAIAFGGNPPTAGTGGYPPAIHQNPSTGQGKTHTITADGTQDLRRIAIANGITEAVLVSYNLNLARYVGSGKKIPKGTKVKV